jgi:hypothetical protein
MATAAALTVTTNNKWMSPHDDDVNDPCLITLDWTSTDLGVVSLGVCEEYNDAWAAAGKKLPYVAAINGRISTIETIPGALGVPATTPPTDLYDVTLLDAYGYDVADGNLANLSSTLAKTLVFDTPIAINSEITLTISAAGDAKNGRIIITVVK